MIANHVDEIIKDLVEKGADGSVSKLAMLASINITEEYFSERDSRIEDEREKEQFHRDIAHYQKLWEEAKRSHLQYKEDAKAIQKQKDIVQDKLSEKAIELDKIIRDSDDKDETIKRLESELEAAKEKLQNYSDQSEEGSEMIRELKDKLKEIEGNYFELQMENIQMKGDLEHYRNNFR